MTQRTSTGVRTRLADVAWMLADPSIGFGVEVGVLLETCGAFATDERLLLRLARTAIVRENHDHQKRTRLQHAAMSGNLVRVQQLLALGARVDAPGDEPDGDEFPLYYNHSPLAWAVFVGHTAIAHMLLAAGAQPNLALHAMSSLHSVTANVAARTQLLLEFAQAAEASPCLLLKLGMTLRDVQVVERYASAAFALWRSGDENEFNEAVFEIEYDDLGTGLAEGPDHVAVARLFFAQSLMGDEHLVMKLGKAGQLGDESWVRELVGDPTTCPHPDEALFAVCGAGVFDLFVPLYDRAQWHCRFGEFPWEDDNHSFVLAAERGHVDILRWHFDHCDMESQGQLGWDINLLAAVHAGFVADVRWLISQGANVNSDVFADSRDFRESCLSVACYRADVEMVSILLEASADVEFGAPNHFNCLRVAVRNDEDWHVGMHAPPRNRPPLTPAEETRRVDIVSQLVAAGADADAAKVATHPLFLRAFPPAVPLARMARLCRGRGCATHGSDGMVSMREAEAWLAAMRDDSSSGSDDSSDSDDMRKDDVEDASIGAAGAD
jgi:ankyrin repeat protein